MRLYRVTQTHDRDADFHDWYDTGEVRYLDSLGRRNGSWCRWLVFRCNNFDCPGEVIVSEQAVKSLLPEVPA